MPIWAEREQLLSTRTFLAIAILLLGTLGCRSGPRAIAPTFPLEPGLDACTTTIETNGVSGTIRTVRDAKTHRALIDLDGDGTPEEQRVSQLDGDGRITQIEVFTGDGNTIRSRETRTWEGRNLVRRSIDKLDAEGRPGVDGVADEVHELAWQDGTLVRESIDQLSADGLLGADGEPEFVTSWTHADGKRTTGTRVDVRDDAVLRVDRLSWSGDNLARQEIDLGGDGVVDTTIVNTWENGRLVAQTVDGKLEKTRVSYSYCD